MPINSFGVDMQNYNAISKSNDYFTSEFVINETPIGARNLLTRGFIQDEISSFSGAAISTRGRYMSKSDHKNQTDRPLYLFLQGPSKQSIEMAIQKIEEIIRNGVGSNIRQNYIRSNDTIQSDTKLSGVMQVEKIFIGLDHISSFDLRNKIIGQGGSNLQYIRAETGAAVTLRGRGSQFIDPQLGHESPENMHLFIEHPQTDGMVAARQLSVNLIETLVQELQQVTSEQQAVSMSNSQLMNIPPRLIGIPPLSVPPPQQQFATVQQAPQSIDQPVIINSSQSEMQNQVQLRNQQIQQLGQSQQSVMIQQPPPLARAPIVNIPPPGIHIPQHAGPMVPPPQIVQLSGPPPTAPSSANVLVVAQPPPAQSMYLPSDLASSSVGTFSLLQGGVLYHQAPPIQTQAQIGDGLHIISAPPQGAVDNINISMNSHTQPPPHMIIAQVQLEPSNQGEQISFQQPVVSQQQKGQFHVIGHVQNAISQEGQPGDNFAHYTVNNQTSTPTSLVLTVPYHIPASISTTCTVTAIPVTQNQIQQIDATMKQIPRVLHTASFDRQRNDRTTIAVQLSNTQIQTSQSSMEQMIMSQPLNSQPIVNTIQHMPINQIPPPQMQNNFLSNQSNLLASQQNAQVIISQDMNQVAGQLPPNQMMAPTHQVMNQEGINQQSINIQQSLQSQVQRHLQFNQSSYDHQPLRQDNWNRPNQGRIRKPLRNNRQYPWIKNQNDSPWSKRDTERKHEDYGNDGRPRYQQSSDSSQMDDWKNQQHRDRSANNNQHNQRNYQQYDKSDGKSQDNCNSRKRSEKSENYQEDDNGRKRKFDSDNNWSSRSDGNQNSSTESGSGHKSRFEPEDKSDGFKQTKHKSSGSKVFGQNDQTKPDKDTTSKWLDQSGEGLRCGNFDKQKQDEGNLNKHSDMGRNVDLCSNQTQTEPNHEKHNDQISNNVSEIHNQQVTSWGDQRSDFKGNVQYVTAGQYHMQNINEDNSNIQQKYVNGPPMYQSNMPYLLPPPPPPPPRAQQHNVQFNMSQGSSASHVPIVNSIPMKIVSSMASHQNVPFDIISNVPQSNANQNITTSIPAVLTQNVQAHLLNQNVVANIAQSMHNMAPYITQSMSNTVPNIMVQNLTSSSMIVPNTTNAHSIPMSVSNISMSMPTVMGQISVGPSMVPPPQTIMHGNVPHSISNMVPPPVLPANICSSRPQMTHSVSVPQSMSTQQPAYPYWMG